MAKLTRREPRSSAIDYDYRSAMRGSWKLSLPSDVPLGVALIRAWLLLFVLVLPWYYGSVTWQAQIWMIWAALPLAIMMIIGQFLGWFRNNKRHGVPFFAVILVIVAVLGCTQSLRIFSSGRLEPSSVQIQRYMLAETNDLDDSLLSEESKRAIAFAKLNGTLAKESQPSPLAASIAPEKSLGAVGPISVAAILCCAAFAAFQTTQSQRWLFLAIVVTGGLMSCIGLYQAIGQSIPWLENIRRGTPYGTFVSRNSAGGFLNVCMSASLGLMSIAFASTTRKNADSRYRVHDETWLAKITGRVEDRLANLDSKQVASIVALAILITGIVSSASRGATVSMVAASVVAILVSTKMAKSASGWILGFVVAGIAVSLLAGLELDTRIRDRFETALDDGVARNYIWEVATRAARFYWLTGSGLGTFHFSTLPFQDTMIAGWYYHAESLILEFFVETGILGVLLFTVGVAAVVVQLRVHAKGRRKDHLPILLSGSYLLVSMLIHNSVDFCLLMPAVFAPSAMLLGAMIGSAVAEEPQRENRFEALKRKSRRKGDVAKSSGPEPTLGNAKVHESEPQKLGMMRVNDETAQKKTTPYPSRFSTFALPATMAVAIALAFVSLAPLSDLARADNFERRMAAYDRSVIDLEQAIKEASLTDGKDEEEFALPIEPDWEEKGTGPEWLRMQAEQGLRDFRKTWLEQMPKGVDIEKRATDPFLFHLAARRLQASNQLEQLPELIGGQAQLERMENTSVQYAQARPLSPLDWRLLWGSILCDWKESNEFQSRNLASLVLVSANKPSLQFQMGLLADNAGNRDLALGLWQQAMEADRSVMIRVATMLAESGKDGEIDLAIFPNDMPALESVALRVLTSQRFPQTYAQLWKQIATAAEKLPETNSMRWFWLAKAAKEANDSDREFEFLEKTIRTQPYNVSIRQRYAILLANRGEFQLAINELDRCLQSSPEDKSLQQLKKQIVELSLKTGVP